MFCYPNSPPRASMSGGTLKPALLFLLLVWLTGCEPIHVINQLTPRDDFTLNRDLSYGPDPRHRLDLYVPTEPVNHRSVIVFVHGGRWDSGDKDQYLFVGQAFASLGYVTAIPNYRLFPQVQYPEFVDDIARAIASLKQHLAQQVCADGRAIILAGHSAGAHTASLIATDPRHLAKNRVEVEFKAWIGIAGPYDLPLEDPAVIGKFDDRIDDRETNAVALASAGTPPTLLIHGGKDVTVGIHHTESLRAKLDQQGVPHMVRIYPETNHTRVIAALASSLRFLNPIYQDVDGFLASRALRNDCYSSADEPEQHPVDYELTGG